MPGNPHGHLSLAKRSKIPAERIKYIPDAGPEIIQTIERGMLVLIAFWSGSSFTSFEALTEVLARIDSDQLELVAVDVDGSPELSFIPEFYGRVHGYGEVAWIRNGKIIATSEKGWNIDFLEENTKALLRAP